MCKDCAPLRVGRIGCQVIVPYRGDGYWARELKLCGDLGQIVNFPCDMKSEDAVKNAVLLVKAYPADNMFDICLLTLNFRLVAPML